MTVWKYFKRDFRLGIVKRIYIMLFPALYMISEVINCRTFITSLRKADIGNGTVMDYFLYATEGMPIYEFDPKGFYVIPIGWFVFEIGMAYYTAYYAYNDFTDYGRFTVISGKDRRGYWTSKCLWCILSVIIYYAVVMLVVTAGALICGASLSLKFSGGIMEEICSGASYVTQTDMLTAGLAVPALVNTGMCLLEMQLSFYLTPVVSFAAAAAYSIIGTYYTSPVFLGNFAMWLRSSYMTEGGVSPASGLILGFALIAGVYYAGRQHFRKVDII